MYLSWGIEAGKCVLSEVKMEEVVWADLRGERVVKISVRWVFALRVRRKVTRNRVQRESPRPLRGSACCVGGGVWEWGMGRVTYSPR